MSSFVIAGRAAEGVVVHLYVNKTGEQNGVVSEQLGVKPVLVVFAECVLFVVRQRVAVRAVGDGDEAAVFRQEVCRSHADGVLAAGQRTSDGDGRVTRQIDVVGSSAHFVAGDLYVAADGHCGVSRHTHTSAVSGGGIAGDTAAVHIECAGIAVKVSHMHTAPAIGACILGDRAAVHIEYAVARDPHTAARRGVYLEPCDLAAVQIERTAPYIHSALIVCAPADRARAHAVGHRDGNALANIDGIMRQTRRILRADLRGDRLAVQAQHNVAALGRFPLRGQRHIVGQVVIAALRGQFAGCAGPCLEGHLFVAGVSHAGAGIAAADGMPVGHAVVEVDDIAADGAVFTRLLQEYVAAAVVRDKITLVVSARLARVRGKTGDRGMLARGDHAVAHPHADLGAFIQAALADVEGRCRRSRSTAGGHIDITIRTARVLVPRDLHIAGDEQPVTSPIIHTAATLGGCVAGDAAAAHLECAAVHIIYAAAVGRRVVGDAAAVHVEIALFAVAGEAHIHAAAVIGRVAGDAAAVHVDGGILAHIHAAAANFGASIDFDGTPRIAGDGAAVHDELRLAGVAAALHIHAAAGLAGSVGDLTGALAVGEREGPAGSDFDDVLVTLIRDAVAVQAKDHTADRFPCIPAAQALNIRNQVVVTRLGDIGQRGNAHPAFPIGEVMAAVFAALVAADGVLVGQTVIQPHLIALLPGGIGFGFVAEDAVLGVAIARAMGDGDIAAGGDRTGVGHADLGVLVQTALADHEGIAARQIDVVIRASRILIAVDGHAAGDGEPGVRIFIHIHAAAFGRAVAADRTAGQLECIIIKGCAAADAIGSLRLVVGDAAAPHGEGSAYCRYAAAISCRRVAADLAAVHRKAAAVMRVHTAAAVVRYFFNMVIRDPAVVQDEFPSVHLHTGAVLSCAGGAAHTVAADLAAEHGKGGAAAGVTAPHASAEHACRVGDLAAAPTVAQRKLRTLINRDDALKARIAVLGGFRKAVPVEAEIELIARCHSQDLRPLRIARKIDVGGLCFGIIRDRVLAVPCRPRHNGAFARMVADVGVRRAADGVGMLPRLLRRQFGQRRAKRLVARHIQRRQLLAGQRFQRRLKGHKLRLQLLRADRRHFLRQRVDERLCSLHRLVLFLFVLLALSAGVLADGIGPRGVGTHHLRHRCRGQHGKAERKCHEQTQYPLFHVWPPSSLEMYFDKGRSSRGPHTTGRGTGPRQTGFLPPIHGKYLLFSRFPL